MRTCQERIFETQKYRLPRTELLEAQSFGSLKLLGSSVGTIDHTASDGIPFHKERA
jgi:hypothetical protein